MARSSRLHGITPEVFAKMTPRECFFIDKDYYEEKKVEAKTIDHILAEFKALVYGMWRGKGSAVKEAKDFLSIRDIRSTKPKSGEDLLAKLKSLR